MGTPSYFSAILQRDFFYDFLFAFLEVKDFSKYNRVYSKREDFAVREANSFLSRADLHRKGR